MPVVGLRHWVPCPVGCLEIFENDSGVLVFFRRFAPDIEILVREIIVVAGGVGPGWARARCCVATVSARSSNSVARDSAPRFLEPRILIRRVIDHQFSDHAQVTLMRGVEKRSEIVE